MAKKPKLTICILIIRGKPKVIVDDDGEAAVWPNIDKAREFTMTDHLGVTVAENILLLDCATGEVEVL